MNEMKMTSMRNIQDTGSVSSNNMTNPNSSNHLSQGPSQQELIRLLAQHFNRQFYQLAQSGTNINNNNNNNSNNDLSSILQPANNTTGSNNVNLHHSVAQYQQQLQQQQQQQQQHQYLINQDAVNFSLASRGSADLANTTLNLTASNSNEQPFLANQLFGSHQQSTQTPERITPTTSIKAIGRSIAGHGLEFVTSPLVDDSIAPMIQNNIQPSIAMRLNDVNFFNALNLTNDQFVLSLHQQYLLQAASAASQYGLKDQHGNNVDNLNHLHPQHHTRHIIQQQQHQQQQQQQQQQAALRSRRNQISVKHTGKGLIELNDSHSENGRELLKFSINTILGRGSPIPTSSALGALQRTKAESPNNHDGKLLISGDKLAGARTSSKQAKDDDELQRQLSSPDCDQNVTTDFGSDSSSTVTPNPQPPDALPSTSIVFNHYQTRALPTNHPSATSAANQIAGLQQQVATEQNRSMSLNQHPNEHHASLSFLSGTATFPWTVAARGKPRRGMMRRAVFSDGQRVGLEKRFQLQKYISKPDRKKLAEKLGLRDSQVKIWFQNRRMKWRNSKERELLSAGGSREQTLPTRNNPNPDLSDVGETVKKLTTNSNGNSAV